MSSEDNSFNCNFMLAFKQLSESNLSHLMKIAIETEDKLTDSDLEAIVDI